MSTTAKLKRSHRKFTRDDLELTLISLPSIIWLFVFCYLPMPGILLAFKKYQPIAGQNFFQNLFGSQWNGFDNLRSLLTFTKTPQLVFNTLFYNIVFICIGAVLPVLFAIMMSQIHSKRFQKFTQTLSIFPNFLSWVVVSAFVFAFLSDARGYINTILVSWGMQPIRFYNSPEYWRGLFIFVNIWKGLGFGSVVYLAAISGIDQSYYEAAMIDGASKWQQAKYVTIPAIKTLIIIQFILAIGRIFSSDWGMFYLVSRQSPSLYNQWATIDTYVYSTIIAGSPSGLRIGAAVGFVQSVLGLLMILGANAIVNRIDPDSALF